MAVVLCISSDEALTLTRKLILEEGGHRVVTAYIVHVRQECHKPAFDVVVVGHRAPSVSARVTYGERNVRRPKSWNCTSHRSAKRSPTLTNG